MGSLLLPATQGFNSRTGAAPAAYFTGAGYKKLLLVFLVVLALLSLALTQVDRLLLAAGSFLLSFLF